METTCNGWTNYETWVVKLWIDNDQGLQAFWDQSARNRRDNPPQSDVLTPAESALYALENDLKTQHEEGQHEEGQPLNANVYADLLNASLGRVNWREIAQAIMESLEERS